MARTTVEIDEDLLRRAMSITGARTKREAIDIALRALVDRSEVYSALRRLRGKFAWQGDVDGWRRSRTS